MRRRQFTLLLGGTALASLTGLPAVAGLSESCGIPRARDDGWAIPGNVNDNLIDREALCRMADQLAISSNVHAVLAARSGKLVFERYFSGSDEVPSPFLGSRLKNVVFDADTLHNVKSVSKSVASLVVGIAIDQGLIRGVNESIFSFFPEYADLRSPAKDRIQLKHVLTMTMGMEWVEATPATGANNDESRMHRAVDPARYVLGLASTSPPGNEFFYNTGALTLASAIVRKATGRPLDEFARKVLFEPLGITDVEWSRVKGDTDAGGGLRLRPRDMAKIGQLVLAGGRWNDRQIVSRDWIETSTTSKIKATDDQYYGYLWWLGRARTNAGVVNWIGALGRGGQSIRIVPERNLVVAVTAGYYQDYSAQAFKLQFGVFRDVLRAIPPPG
jgi:CubicO group peptidase (beta-lactamase class C family)